MLRVTLDQTFVVRQIRDVVADVNSDIAVGETGTIATLLHHDYFARPRFLLIILCVFASIALLLVAAGIFSVISYSIVLRTHEIGIRTALGAQSAQVLVLILKEGTTLIFSGLAVGLAVAYALARALAAEIWGVSATDPSTFIATALLALMIGVLACYIPARRATKVDPLVALRYE